MRVQDEICVSDPALAELLRLSAALDRDETDYQPLVDTVARLRAWSALPAAAEAHGLAPLVHFHFSRARISCPPKIERRLLGLTLAHAGANRLRFQVLREILDLLDEAAIPVLVLKGAALAHILYPSKGLRPLSDIDLLVAPSLASRAQSALATAGFSAPLPPPSWQFGGHHHLPAAVRVRDGHEVRVEVHTNALTRDTPGSLSMDQLSDVPQEFPIEGRTARTLGHADMLYHLCRHTSEPVPLLRLVWVADVVGYATRYREVIPWADLRRRSPFVLNALSLLHLLTPLPPELTEYVALPDDRGLRGVGTACKPLNGIFRRDRGVRDIRRDLFDPSDWWLRFYYGVDDGSLLWWYRWVRHPLQVAHWLTRRAGASLHRRTRGMASAYWTRSDC